MAQTVFKTIKEPKLELRHAMKALTEVELDLMLFDEEEENFVGAGLIVVEGSADKTYIFIRKDDLPPEYCSLHNTEMKKKSVMTLNGHFKATTMYYQCDEVLGPNYPSGKRNLCHDNLYPLYPSQQL